jgi:hypothetical protein
MQHSPNTLQPFEGNCNILEKQYGAVGLEAEHGMSDAFPVSVLEQSI